MYKVVITGALALATFPVAASAHHQTLTDDGLPTWWCQQDLTYVVDADTEASLGNDGMRALRSAAGAWMGLKDVPVIRIESSSRANAREPRVIVWVDDWEDTGMDRRFLGVTDNTFHKHNGRIVSSAIRINGTQSFSFDAGAPEPYLADFESFMTHEFGHALGLDHNEAPDSVMRHKLEDGEMNREPNADDEAAVEDSYARAGSCPTIRSQMVENPPACSATAIRHAMGGNNPALMMMCAVMLTFLYRLFQRPKKK